MKRAAPPGRLPRLVILGLVLSLGAACIPQVETPQAPDEQVPSSGRTPKGSSSLLFLRGRSLLRLDIASGRRTRLGDFPTPDVWASPGSGWIAYVAPGQAMSESHPDFLADPRLRLFDVGSGEEVALGRGFSPLWDPSGSRVAYLRSSPARSCEGETCAGAVSVRVAWPGKGTSETLLEEGSYGLLGWAGDRLLVSDGSDSARILSVGPEGDELKLPLPPSRFWGASPDGRWMVRVGDEKTEFVRLRAGRLTAETTPIALGRRVLAAGGWAADSSGIAAVVLGGRTAPEVGLFTPKAPELRALPHSKGVTDAPLWSSNGDSLLFPRDSGDRMGTLDARLCRVDPRGDRTRTCPALLSWREGVVLLRMEP